MRTLVLSLAAVTLLLAGCVYPFGYTDRNASSLPPKYVLNTPIYNLPDLEISRWSCEVRGDGKLFVQIRVINRGVLPAATFNTVVRVQGYSQEVSTRSTADLASNGAEARLGFFFSEIQTPGHFSLEVTVDPPDATHPGGEIWETTKDNNHAVVPCSVQ